MTEPSGASFDVVYGAACKLLMDLEQLRWPAQAARRYEIAAEAEKLAKKIAELAEAEADNPSPRQALDSAAIAEGGNADAALRHIILDVAKAAGLLMGTFSRAATGPESMFELRHRLGALGHLGGTLAVIWQVRIEEGDATEEDYREARDFSAFFPPGFGI